MSSTIRKMQLNGFSVSLEAYNIMLDAYGKKGEMEKFKDVLQRMKETRCAPDHYTYNIIINIYGERGWIEEFFDVLTSVKREIVENQKSGLMKEAERFLLLNNIDRLWKEHLQALKFVQQAVGLRGYAQRDPLIEYKLEGYNLFIEMMAQIGRNVIYSIYQFKPVVNEKEQARPEKSSKLVKKGKWWCWQKAQFFALLLSAVTLQLVQRLVGYYYLGCRLLNRWQYCEADPPRKDGGDLLLNKVFLRACSTVYSVFPGGQENNELPFIPKHFNVIDPLRANNNLGRSVNGSSDVTNPLNSKKIQSAGREVKLQKSSHSSNGILPQKGNHVFKTNSRTNNNTSGLQSQKTSANLTYSVASNQSNHIPQSL
ncbi:hypothetical protein POM88_025377 [Heracleum sosnowskyi]|uniref:Pentatricopeptide repeat-containing protein n=1 Tax=Heracleum sosnowskyi TaxID=360622 RepID=A0AAD8MNS3_9APIA|nr:hypothetical protein POM88_025377 [Heracleum sosnowskyi]